MSKRTAPAPSPALAHSIVAISASELALWLFGLLFSLPFLVPFHDNPIPSFQSEWLAFALALAASLLTASRQTHWHLPQIALAPLGLALVVLLQLLLGMFAYESNALMLISYLLWAALLMITAQSLVQQLGTRRLFTSLAWFMLAGAIVNACCGLLQYFQLNQFFGEWVAPPMALNEFGVYGNLAQQNHFATHLGLGLASATFLYLQRRRWQLLVCGALLLTALILSGSRSGLLFIAWLLALTLWRAYRGNARSHESAPAGSKRRLWLALVTLLVALSVLGLAASQSQIAPHLAPQLQRLSLFANAIGVRGFLWQHALQMFIQHPLLGVGFDNFAFNLVDQLQTPNPWGVDQYAHNLFMQLLAVSGLLGTLVLALPCLAYLRRLWRAGLDGDVFWCWAMLGILFIHSMLEQPLFFAYFLAIVAVICGASETRARQLRLEIGLSRILRPIASVVLIVACAVLVKTGMDYAKLVRYCYSAQYLNEGAAAEMLQQQRRAAILDLHQHSYFTALTELAAPEEFVAFDSSPLDKIALNHRILHFAPVAETEYRQAALLAEAGKLEDAKRQFKRAALAYPQEGASYLERFDSLALGDAQTYGKLAKFAHQVLKKP